MSWASTFARFQPGRIPLVGPIAVRVADWSRPQPGWALMFDEQPLLERLSIARPVLPALLYTSIGVYLLWRGRERGLAAAALAGSYLLGLLIWSLLEYVAHRVSFHHVPETPGEVAYGYVVHGVHHAYPDDARHWMIPLVVTIPLAFLFYVAFSLAFGRWSGPAFAGFLHGYLTYDLVHYFIHRGRMPTRLGKWVRQYHLVHHFKTPDRHYGVSSPLWDFIFRTR